MGCVGASAELRSLRNRAETALTTRVGEPPSSRGACGNASGKSVKRPRRAWAASSSFLGGGGELQLDLSRWWRAPARPFSVVESSSSTFLGGGELQLDQRLASVARIRAGALNHRSLTLSEQPL